jgi:hypothetical protein
MSLEISQPIQAWPASSIASPLRPLPHPMSKIRARRPGCQKGSKKNMDIRKEGGTLPALSPPACWGGTEFVPYLQGQKL